MPFEKIKMTEKQLIDTVFDGSRSLYTAFQVFRKYNIGMTKYDHMVMAVSVNIEVVSDEEMLKEKEKCQSRKN